MISSCQQALWSLSWYTSMGQCKKDVTPLLMQHLNCLLKHCSRTDQRKHQAFVRGIHRWPVDSPHKGSVTPKNVFNWWCHHGTVITQAEILFLPSIAHLTTSNISYVHVDKKVTLSNPIPWLEENLVCQSWLPISEHTATSNGLGGVEIITWYFKGQAPMKGNSVKQHPFQMGTILQPYSIVP